MLLYHIIKFILNEMEIILDYKDFNILLNKGQYEQVLDIFEKKIQANDKLNLNIFNRLLISLERNNQNKKIIEIFDKSIINKLIKYEETTFTILVRASLILNLEEKAFNYLEKLNKKYKKRNLIPFYDYYYNKKDCHELYNFHSVYLKNKILLTSEEYQKIFELLEKNNDPRLIEFINDINGKKISFNLNSKYNCSINEGICNSCHNNLGIVDLTLDEKKMLLSNLDDIYIKTLSKKNIHNFSKFKLFLKDNDFDIIIDVANILYYGERKITFKSYLRINKTINKLKIIYPHKKILLIIHNKYYNYLDSNFQKDISKKIKSLFEEWRKITKIYFTPHGMNDDWFIVFAGLTFQKSYVVSNDLFRDHKFQITEEINFEDLFSKWYDAYKIAYDFDYYQNLEIILPIKYSKRVQLNGNHFHIPNGEDWLCISKTF